MSTQKLHELDRRVTALEDGGRPNPAVDHGGKQLADLVNRAADGLQGLDERLKAVEADAATAGERVTWLKDHADQMDETGKAILDRLDDIVGKLTELEKRVAALEPKKGRTNG